MASARMPLCDQIETLAMVYLDGELADADARELEVHVRECDACRRHVAMLGAALEALRRLAAARSAPEGLRTRIRAALDSEDARARRMVIPPAAWAAAGAALIVLVVAIVQPASRRGDPRDAELPATAPPLALGDPWVRTADVRTPLRFDWAARRIHDRPAEREVTELWRVRDHLGNSIFIEARFVIQCGPVRTAGDLRLRQYPE